MKKSDTDDISDSKSYNWQTCVHIFLKLKGLGFLTYAFDER